MAKEKKDHTELASVNNPTPATYNLTLDGVPVTIKPGLNSGLPLLVAKLVVRDLNAGIPGTDNNPFTVE